MKRIFEVEKLEPDALGERWRVTNRESGVSCIQYGDRAHVEDVVARMDRRWAAVGRDTTKQSWKDEGGRIRHGRPKSALRLEVERVVAQGLVSERGESARVARELAARFEKSFTYVSGLIAQCRKKREAA